MCEYLSVCALHYHALISLLRCTAGVRKTLLLLLLLVLLLFGECVHTFSKCFVKSCSQVLQNKCKNAVRKFILTCRILNTRAHTAYLLSREISSRDIPVVICWCVGVDSRCVSLQVCGTVTPGLLPCFPVQLERLRFSPAPKHTRRFSLVWM